MMWARTARSSMSLPLAMVSCQKGLSHSAFARAYRDLVRAHPNLALLLIANVEAGGASVLEASERLYEALERSGLPDRLIVSAAGVVVDYVHGFALSEGLALRS